MNSDLWWRKRQAELDRYEGKTEKEESKEELSTCNYRDSSECVDSLRYLVASFEPPSWDLD